MDRVRADLRARAQRASVHRRAEALALAAVPASVIPARRGPFAGWSVRRASFATAASLVLGVSIATTTFAASRAGGPLYASRIWVDTATLPTELGPRLQAELAFAETRLAEASAAAADDDAGGVTAALDAFNAIIVMTADEQAAQGAAPGVALQAFQHHLAVLRALVATVPATAQGKVAEAHALAESGKAVHVLETSPGQPASIPGRVARRVRAAPAARVGPARTRVRLARTAVAPQASRPIDRDSDPKPEKTAPPVDPRPRRRMATVVVARTAAAVV